MANKIIHFTLVTAILVTMAACTHEKPQTESTITPLPNSIAFHKGHFTLTDGVTVLADEIARTEKELIKEYLSANAIKTNEQAEQTIKLELETQLNRNEYSMEVAENTITIQSGGNQGLKYGIQTLRQLLFEGKKNKNQIQCQTIHDSPTYEYRGMHLDVARHFMPADFIMQYIDMMAILKMNYFHWHLVDDQGWRIEIKKYPKLTEVGAYRKETLIGHGAVKPFEYDGKPHGGYYTQEQIKEIVAYAEDRGITIIPEIEMPGHARSAIAAYPELGVTGEQIEVWTRWGVSPYIYNVEETTFDFLEGVLDEVAELFPGKYIHIGGDEAVKDQWEASARIQERMHEFGVEDEAGLQSYFIRRIADYLHTKNKTIVGWDEILEGGAPENAVVTFWRSWVKPSPALEAAEEGHKIIFTPSSLCYFDHYQTTMKDSIEPPAIGGCTPVDSLYIQNPIKNNLPKKYKHLVWGAQGNVWTEYMKTPDHVEHMVMPRMAALAEILWTTKDKQNVNDFKRRFRFFADWLEKNDINYAPYIFEESKK